MAQLNQKKNKIVIREYESLRSKKGDRNYISQWDDLEKFVLKNETHQYLKIAHEKGSGKVIKAQNFVGIIQTKDGTTIEILPKISVLDNDKDGIKAKQILVKMLKTLRNSPFKHFDTAHLSLTKKLPLLEIFISMFLDELTVLVQRGIKSDYISKEENQKFLKGKLKISEHIRKNYIHKERFYVEYQEYISDRVENRLIKTTLQYLYKKSKRDANQQRIREFLFVFDEIGISHNFKTDFAKIHSNRQMRDYEQVLLWCRTFLLGNSFSPYKGNDVAFALLFDMNMLFESYIGHLLKKEGLNVKLQDKSHYLACLGNSGKFQLKPDIVINGGEVIADTKWKILRGDKRNQGVSQSDMYQLFAYGKTYSECNDMFLIYPKQENDYKLKENKYFFEKSKDCKSNLDNLNLKILFFDLSKIINSKDNPKSESIEKSKLIADIKKEEYWHE